MGSEPVPAGEPEVIVATELHLRLMRVAFDLQKRGEEDLAAWIQKHIADEQRAASRRPSRRGMKVRLARSGGPAFLPETAVKEALREADREVEIS